MLPQIRAMALLSAAPLLYVLSGSFVTTSVAYSSNNNSCLYVSSYHDGYPLSEATERGLHDALQQQCHVTQFYMDTKRGKSPQQRAAAGKAAYKQIMNLQPDVVITSGDNAAKYLIVPHLLGKDIPIIFSGINRSADDYGFPASNITGIVENLPVKPMLVQGARAADIKPYHPSRIAYLGASTLSEINHFNRVKSTAEQLNMTVDRILVTDFNKWKTGFELAQAYDFVVMGNIDGIAKFSEQEALAWVQQTTRTLSITNHEQMMPYAALGYTKVVEEHGEWAAAQAIAILEGTKTQDIPIVSNRRWNTLTNNVLLAKLGITLEQNYFIEAHNPTIINGPEQHLQ